jgi:hypothetical protein
MEQFNDFARSIGASLKQGLGLRPSDRRRLADWKANYAQDKARKHERAAIHKDAAEHLPGWRRMTIGQPLL